MRDWIERLQEEKSELALKLIKLDKFMCSEKFYGLSQFEKDTLSKQKNAMVTYLDILEYRLANIRIKNIDKSIFYDDNEDVFDTKTEYVTSSTANADNVNKAKSIFEDAIDGHLDALIQTQITPNALITLGFKEEYQHSIDGIAGFLYYTLTLNTVEFCSTSLGEDEPLYVMLGHEGQFSIHNLRKLGDLILSLNEL
tara:strand:+ start:768 stop:1358 length:591 start_codon:yes stop_codon:yes gene_type:complete